MLHFSPLVHHSIRKTGVVSGDVGCVCSSSVNKSPIDRKKQLSSPSASVYQLFVCSLSHCSIWIWCHHGLCPRRKRGWPTARQWRRRVPPPRPRCSTGCSWMTTWKQMSGTSTPPQKPATFLSRSTTQRSTSPPWRPTSPTESPPRSAIGWCHGNTEYLVFLGQLLLPCYLPCFVVVKHFLKLFLVLFLRQVRHPSVRSWLMNCNVFLSKKLFIENVFILYVLQHPCRLAVL